MITSCSVRYPTPAPEHVVQLAAGPRGRTACSSDAEKFAWLRLELCTRVSAAAPRDAPALLDERAVAAFVRSTVPDAVSAPQEKLVTIGVDVKNRPLGVAVFAVGSVASVLFDPAQAFRPVLLTPSRGCFLVHNHPSGDPNPSADDVQVTRRWIAGARLLGLDPIDHVVVTVDAQYSFRTHDARLWTERTSNTAGFGHLAQYVTRT